ncbi:putative paraoxonase [Xylariomycetidae sp. FL0641]|nr:putative paraoxonase [Xylariomycetidae sp. FL0641]
MSRSSADRRRVLSVCLFHLPGRLLIGRPPSEQAASVLVLALLSPWLYDRAQTLSLFFANAPGRFVRIDAVASHQIKFADRIRSCEDAVLLESQGLAILACDPGREMWNTVMGIFLPGPVPSAELYIYDYKDATLPDSEALQRVELVDFDHAADFHTLGIAYDEATSTLFATSHRHDWPAIEMFHLDLTTYTATHQRSIQSPLVHGPNAIALLNERELLVTNNNRFVARAHPLLNKLETFSGYPGGTVVHVDTTPALAVPGGGPVNARVVAHVAFANGIDLFANRSTVAVASSSRATVYLFSVSRPSSSSSSSSSSSPPQTGYAPPALTLQSQFRLPFLPDNVAVSGDGALLIAGHPHMPSLETFAKSRHVCNAPALRAAAGDAMREFCGTFAAPSWAASWTPEGGLRNLYAGYEYPSSATAARDARRGVGVVAGLYAKGIMVWRD